MPKTSTEVVKVSPKMEAAKVGPKIEAAKVSPRSTEQPTIKTTSIQVVSKPIAAIKRVSFS
jgi:hypothetical protein